MGGRSALQQKHSRTNFGQRRTRKFHRETSAIYHNTHTPSFPNMRLILFTDRTPAGCDSRAGQEWWSARVPAESKESTCYSVSETSSLQTAEKNGAAASILGNFTPRMETGAD